MSTPNNKFWRHSGQNDLRARQPRRALGKKGVPTRRWVAGRSL